MPLVKNVERKNIESAINSAYLILSPPVRK